MKRIIAIIISICLLITPINIYAVTAEDDSIGVKENSISTPSTKTPEEQAIEKIVAHKRAIGEEIPNNTRVLSEDIVSGGIYYIKNYFSGKYLNVHYGVDANGTNVYQWTGDSSTEQKFKVVYDSSTASYKIYAMCSSNGNNRVLDVVRNGSPLASGQNVDIWTPVDHTAQRLKLTSLIYDNLYHIHMLGNKDLYFTTIDKSNGTNGGTKPTSAGNVFIQTFDVNDHQQWQFIRISSAPVTPPTPSYSDPYGWLDEVTENGIRGWAWCQSHPNLALNISIKIYDESNVLQKTITLVANQYRQDVAEVTNGTGYYGFHTSIDWSEFDSGTYTVRAYAGVDTPTTEIHDSPMTYINTQSPPISEALTLNISKTKTLEAGDEHIYSFIPTITGTYVVQTTGNTDTYGVVDIDINGTTITEADNDDGSGSNFNIMFYATSGETVKIKVRHYNATTGTGAYSIKVHRARAQIYTFNYGGLDINTVSDAIIPYSGFLQLGYQTGSYVGEESCHIQNADDSGVCRLNSEVILFSGHGIKVPQDRTSNLCFINKDPDNPNEYDYLSSFDLPNDMANVRLAVWASCYSAIEEDDIVEDYRNIAETAYNNGAKTSIGWKEKISNSYCHRWLDVFFEYICNGYTISDAKYYANYLNPLINTEDGNYSEEELERITLMNNVINSLNIYGNTNYSLEPLTFTGDVNLSTSNVGVNVLNIDDIMENLKNSDYIICDIGEVGQRYIKTINGISTNEYYDVYFDGTVVSSDVVINEAEITKLLTNEKIFYNKSFEKSSIEYDFEMYYKINNELIHVGVFEFEGKICYIDLNGGEEIEYY